MAYSAVVIGCGRVGHNHAQAYASSDSLELEAIADIDEEQLTAFGDLYGIPEKRQYQDYANLLAEESPAVVSVATSYQHHHTHVIDVVTSGIDPDVIWCEKPIATNVRNGAEMVSACDEHDVELIVNHSRRFSYAYEALYEQLHETQLLGELRSVRLTAGPEFLNMGSHYLDLLLYLLDGDIDGADGGQVKSVRRDNSVRYRGGGILTMDDGVTIYIDPFEEAPDRLYLDGTEGRLSTPLSIAPEADHGWNFSPSGQRRQTVSTPPEPFEQLWREDISGTPRTVGSEAVPGQSMFDNAAGHIADLVGGDRENAAPGTRAVDGLEGLVALLLSAQTGTRIRVPLSRPFRDVSLVHSVQ